MTVVTDDAVEEIVVVLNADGLVRVVHQGVLLALGEHGENFHRVGGPAAGVLSGGGRNEHRREGQFLDHENGGAHQPHRRFLLARKVQVLGKCDLLMKALGPYQGRADGGEKSVDGVDVTG